MQDGIPPETLTAAEAGHPQAQFNVGWHYKNGKGVPKDLAQAAKWWRKAAGAGYPAAQYSLGFDCLDVIPADEALRWTQLAADNGLQNAQVYLGWMYFCGGLGLSRDIITAHKWLLLGTRNNPRRVPRIFCKTMRTFMTARQIAEAERLANEWNPRPDANLEIKPQ